MDFFSSSSWNLLYIAMSSQKKLQEASTERWKNGKQNCELHYRKSVKVICVQSLFSDRQSIEEQIS